MLELFDCDLRGCGQYALSVELGGTAQVTGGAFTINAWSEVSEEESALHVISVPAPVWAVPRARIATGLTCTARWYGRGFFHALHRESNSRTLQRAQPNGNPDTETQQPEARFRMQRRQTRTAPKLTPGRGCDYFSRSQQALTRGPKRAPITLRCGNGSSRSFFQGMGARALTVDMKEFTELFKYLGLCASSLVARLFLPSSNA